LPAVFMILTAICALLYQMIKFLREGNIVLAAMSIILMILAVLMVFDVVVNVRRRGLKCKVL